MKNVTITPTIENYLKAINNLSQRDGTTRVVDIAKNLHVSKATVSQTTDKLVFAGLARKEKSKGVWLTTSGREKAERVEETYTILESFLTDTLGVSTEVSRKDACLMEHIVSRQTIEKINNYMIERNTGGSSCPI